MKDIIWEYHTIAVDGRIDELTLRDIMNGAGEEGWEAVSVAMVTGVRTVWLMKRVRNG